jgi:lipoyl(octanoyl) transferase
MNLEPFTRINPCGFAGLQVTDLRSLGANMDLRATAATLAPHLLQELGLNLEEAWF